ncbi:MAG: response regulator [Acidobacteria bacterium]|nr:response regulator [Acidobacteriota bacterium]
MHTIDCPAPAVPAPPDRIPLLAVVSSDGEYGTLESMLTHSNWMVRRALDGREALACLDQSDIPVILCDSDVPEGDWRDLLEASQRLRDPPCFILLSPHNLALWAELLNLGGHDLLEQPLNASEFYKVVGSACRIWRDERKANGSARSSREACLTASA